MATAAQSREELAIKATKLMERFIAECVEKRIRPDITCPVNVPVSETRNSFLGVTLTLRRLVGVQMPGWRIPYVTSQHWILENAELVHYQSYQHYVLGIPTRQSSEWVVTRPDQLSFKDLKVLVRTLEVYFA